MANSKSTNVQFNNNIASIMAEHPTLTVKDIQTDFIKDGGVSYYPVIDENGCARLARKSFTHQHVLDARAAKKAAKAEAKAQRDAEKAQAKAQALAEKAQARLEAAQAKLAEAQAVAAGTAVATETVTTVVA